MCATFYLVPHILYCFMHVFIVNFEICYQILQFYINNCLFFFLYSPMTVSVAETCSC